MRRPILFVLVAAVVLLGGATVVLLQKVRKASMDFAEAKTAEESAQSRYGEAISAIAEIQDSLSAITFGDTSVRLLSPQVQGEPGAGGVDRREALDRIALLSASVQRTKERIHNLEERLRKSGVKVAGLERLVANLKLSVSSKEAAVAELTARVDTLRTSVATLETTVQQSRDTILAQEQNIEQKRRELGTIYYIIGTKQELATSGVILAKGGVLGMGKTIALTGRYDSHRFTPLDTDVETVIRAPAAKVQILSPQPPTSYVLTPAGDQTELRILDPQAFRAVKHLVIMTRT